MLINNSQKLENKNIPLQEKNIGIKSIEQLIIEVKFESRRDFEEK